MEYIKIYPIVAESTGVRSMATFVKTPDVGILLDPGAAVGPRFKLPPHPTEYRILKEETEKILKIADKAEIIFISHYHFDHYLPFFKNYSTQWTDYELASELYSDKVVLLKSIEANITPVQKKRGGSLNKLLKRFSKEVIWADNYRYEIGNTILKTTIAVEHGVGKKFLGYVILPVIMYSIEKFMFVPDVYGPISSNVLDIILKEMPDVIYLDGPPLYLKDLGFGRISLRKVERNLESIIRNVSEMIIDHHVFRSKAGPKFIDSLKAKISNPHKILTVAEKIGVEPRLLEINRQLLWEEDPPTEDFINWTKLEPEIKRRTPPPLTS
ncbi:MAG: hypothetical protein ABGF52_02390 [Candidatus Asgardarchaeum sp.]